MSGVGAAAGATVRPAGRPVPVPAGSVILLLAWSLVAVGIANHDGQYRPLGLLAIVVGWAATLAVLALRLPVEVPRSARQAAACLAAPAAVMLFGALHWTVRDHALGDWQTVSVTLTAAATIAALAAVHPAVSPRPWAFALPFSLAAAAGITVIWAVPNPHIDVWLLLQQSADGLVHGSYMYRQQWVGSTGLQDVYPYLPATTVALVPFRLLVGDVRYGLLAASLVTAILLRRGGRAEWPAVLPLLLLLLPKATYGVEQSWTEPLIIAALVAMTIAVRDRRPWVAVVALAVALAAKQHVVLLLPLAAWLPGFGPRRTAYAGGLAALFVLPWFLAGPRDMWHDAVEANLSLGVIPRALCVPSFLLRHGVTSSFLLLAAALVLAYVVVLGRAPRTPSGFALGSGVVLLTLDVFNQQSFFNHYTLPMAMLVLSLLTLPAHPAPGPGEVSAAAARRGARTAPGGRSGVN